VKPTVDVAESPSEIALDAVPTVGIDVAIAVVAAKDGTAESIPNPSDATATSAMRLKVVFVDICFLSIVDLENFPSSA
jgi:Mrp family chromosome partitioning ATPase